MARAFEKGLHELGNGIAAYLQPDGSWGWSNAGLDRRTARAVACSSIRFFDLKPDGEEMLGDHARRGTPAASPASTRS